MRGDAPVPTIKLLLMGDSGTGKSSLLLRFTEDRFVGEDVQAATIGVPCGASPSVSDGVGVDFKVKFIELDGQRIKLTIWDTAGQERFRTLTSSYYRGAQGVILVYDVTKRETFASLQATWLKELQTYADLDDVTLMLVANKIDKEAERAISTAEGQACAKELSSLFIECSAKTRVGVATAFEDLVHQILNAPPSAVPSALHTAGDAGQRSLDIGSPRSDGSASDGNCMC